MAGYPPHAPMPPDQGGPFEGVEMGEPLEAIHVDDFHRSAQQGNFHPHGVGPQDFVNYDADSDVNRKKSKKNKGQQKGPYVEIHYEGFVLEKADPLPGEKPSWARVGKRTLPVGEKRLQEIVKLHRQKTRQSPQRDLLELTSNQQGIINRLVTERQLNERQRNAEWILADVQCVANWGWTTREIKKIQVILKRQDKYQVKNKDNSTRLESKTYHHGDILDLEEPIKKKNKNKNSRQTRSFDDLDVFDDRIGLGVDRFQHPPPPPPQGNQFFPQQPPPMHDQFNGPPPLPMNMNMNMPFDPHGPGQFQQPPPPPPLARHPSARQPEFGNPFQPDPQFAVHGHHDPHPMDDDDYQTGPRDLNRSQSQRRQSSTRRPSVDARRFSQLMDRVDNLTSKIQNWRVSDDSSQDTREDDSVFSRQHRDDRDFSQPSSPTSYFSRGSLERTKSYSNRPRYRSHRYSDADIEPAYSYRDERRYSVDSRRRGNRPRLHHAHTMDDYPAGRGAEPRYLTAPPPRRLTDFEERYDYEDYDDGRRPRDGRDSRGPRRRSPGGYDTYQERYEPSRRDGDRRRRQSVGGGGRGYYE